MCFVKYFSVTHEQQLENSLFQSLNPYSIQYRFIIYLLAFFASHSIWNCYSKFGFRTDIQVVLKGIPIKRIAWLFLLSRFCLLKKEEAQKYLLLWARKGFVLGINLFQIAFLFFPQPIRSLRDGTFSTREPSVRESTVMTIRNFSFSVKRVFGIFFGRWCEPSPRFKVFVPFWFTKVYTTCQKVRVESKTRKVSW